MASSTLLEACRATEADAESVASSALEQSASATNASDAPCTPRTREPVGSPLASSSLTSIEDTKEFEREASKRAFDIQASVEKELHDSMSSQDKQVYDAVQQGNFDIRSALGLRFQRQAGKDPQYKALGSWEAKRAFRLEWAQTQYRTIVERKTRSRKIIHTQASKGRYLSFRRICQEEGDDDAAVEAAKNYVAKCLELGGVFVLANNFTKRADFLYLQIERNRAFEETWGLDQEERDQPQIPERRGDEKTQQPFAENSTSSTQAPAEVPEKSAKALLRTCTERGRQEKNKSSQQQWQEQSRGGLGQRHARCPKGEHNSEGRCKGLLGGLENQSQVHGGFVVKHAAARDLQVGTRVGLDSRGADSPRATENAPQDADDRADAIRGEADQLRP